MKIITSLLIFLILKSLAFSQPSFQNIYRFDPGAGMTFGALEPTQNGSFYAIGRNPFDNTSVLFKIDSAGNIIWNKKYSTTAGPVILQTIISMPDGGFAAGGTCGNLFLMRGDSTGNMIWAWEYDYFLFEENVNSLVRTPDNGFIFSFAYYHHTQPVLARIDSSGNVIYCKRYEENQNLTLVYNIQMAADSNYFAMLPSANNPKARVMKFDIDGNVIWTVGVGDTATVSNIMWANTMCATPDGGCILGGNLMNAQNNLQSLSICKISSQGNLEWIRALLPSTNQISQISAVTNTYDNGFMLVAMIADTLISSHIQTQITRTDSDGHFLWTKKYAITNAGINKIIERPDHGFILASSIFSSDWNYLITGIDSLGNLFCGNTDIVQNDSTVAMPLFNPLYAEFFHTLDRDSINITVDSGMIVFDACQLLAITEHQQDRGEAIILYPNPFSTIAAFKTEMIVEHAELRIYNSIGMLVREEKLSNINHFILQREDLINGLYFYTLQSTDSKIIGTGKFVIQ